MAIDQNRGDPRAASSIPLFRLACCLFLLLFLPVLFCSVFFALSSASALLLVWLLMLAAYDFLSCDEEGDKERGSDVNAKSRLLRAHKENIRC